MNIFKNNSILSYTMNLLTTLTCLLLLLNIFLLSSVSFDLYEWKQSYQSWVYLYCIVYALIVAVAVDWLTSKFHLSLYAQTILYFVAGFGAFLPITGISFFTIFAGIFAGIIAVIFLICYGIVKYYHKRLWGIVLLLPVLFVFSTLDYSEKKNWHEQRTENSFSAQFSQFNGTHAVPISLERGEKVNMTIHFSSEKEGGYGYAIIDEKDEEVSYRIIGTNDEDVNSSRIYFIAETTGEYRVLITGSKLKGRITVNWEVE